MMLRLSFSGAPFPSEWGAILESVCDLINMILQHDDWDPLTLFNAGHTILWNYLASLIDGFLLLDVQWCE